MQEWVHGMSDRPQDSESPASESTATPQVSESPASESTAKPQDSESSTPAETLESDQSLQMPELSLPAIHVTDEAFEIEIDLAHEKDGPEFEKQSSSNSLAVELTSLAETVLGDIDDGSLKVIIRRPSALQDALRNISRAQTRLLQPLSVRFIAEPAIDDGGLLRELSSEVVNQLMNSSFVEGTENNKLFRHDFRLYTDKKYMHLGQLTALLLLQGGQGLPVFAKSVTDYILAGTISSHINDMPEQIRKAFSELNEMSDAEVSNSIDELLPSRFEQGYSVPSNKITRHQLAEIAQAMVAHHVIQPQKMALDQFRQGLQIVGVLDALQQHKEESEKLFKGAITPLTMDVVENLLTFNYDHISLGSNRILIAQALEQGFILLLQAAESGEAQFQFSGSSQSINLSQIMKWMTGGTRLPAIGLSKSVDIFFDKEAVLPRVNTCSLEIYFPILQHLVEPDSVAKLLVEWIVNSHGFGLV